MLPAPFAFTAADIDEAADRHVYPAMPATPQYAWPVLNEAVDGELWLKHENHTPIGAFKARGGLVWLGRRAEALAGGPGLITATRGNHGQSVAFAARRSGIAVTVVVPHGNSVEKNAAMRALGATIVEAGDDFTDALAATRALATARGLTFVPSFDPDLCLGIASYALELFRAAAFDAVYVPVGQGSGIAAVCAARTALGLATQVIGVVSTRYPTYARSFQAGRPVETTAPSLSTIADGVACRAPDPAALGVIRAGVARFVTVEEPAIEDAMRLLFSATHQVAEGAGAIALAGALAERDRWKGQRVAAVLTGGNVDRDVYQRLLAGP